MTDVETGATCPACTDSGQINGSPCPDCYDPSSYGAEKDYDAADFGPVETDPAVVEALLQEQLEHLKEAGFTANG